MRDGDRRDHLDGTRGVAACVVFFGHLSIALTNAIWIFNGNAAVCIFFVLSGFVLAELVQRSPLSFPAQATRRYVRLLGPMLITSTLAWGLLVLGAYRNIDAAEVTGSAWLASWYHFEPSFSGMVREMAYGAFASGESIYNCNLWTMQPELIGSLYVFLIGAILPFKTGRALCYIALGIWYWPSYIALFSVGALLYEFSEKFASIIRWTSLKAAIAATGLFFCIATEKWLAALQLPSMDMTELHMIAGSLIVLIVITWDHLQKLLSLSPARWLGRISFTLYLLHVPIICSLTSWLVVTLPRAIALSGAAAITIAVVFASSTFLNLIVDEIPTRVSRAVGYAVQTVIAQFKVFARRSIARRLELDLSSSHRLSRVILNVLLWFFGPAYSVSHRP